ncbi:MAG: hypothetical protein U9N57_01225 [Pseudomonadota bacterium]|nr:hypothetical protein [Pseudomonadota bacterium]
MKDQDRSDTTLGEIPLIDETMTGSLSEESKSVNEFFEEDTLNVEPVKEIQNTASPSVDQVEVGETSESMDLEEEAEELDPKEARKQKIIDFLKDKGIYLFAVLVLVFVVGIPLMFGGNNSSSSNSFNSSNVDNSGFTFDEAMEPEGKIETTTSSVSPSEAQYVAPEPAQLSNTNMDLRVPTIPRYLATPDQYMTEEEVKNLFVEEINKVLTNDRKDFIDFKKTVTEQMTDVTQSFFDVKKSVYQIQKDLEGAASNGDLDVILNTVTKVSQALDQQEVKLESEYRNLNTRLKKIESMPINAKPVKGTVAKSELKPAVRYRIASAMRGKAWIRNKDGKLVFLEVGDRLKGYGQVLKITPDGGGRIFTVSGEVELIRE